MTTKPDPIHEITNQATLLIENSNAGGTGDVSQGSDPFGAAFILSENNPTGTLSEKNSHIQALESRLAEQELLTRRLLALNQFDQELGKGSDPERSARSMSRLLYRLYHCGLIGIYSYQAEETRFKLLAAAGPLADKLPGAIPRDSKLLFLDMAPQAQSGLRGSASNPISINGQPCQSVLVAPLNGKNDLSGLIMLADPKVEVFQAGDCAIVETAAGRLKSAWESAQRGDALTAFIQSITSFSNVQETSSLMERIAAVARSTLDGSFAVVANRSQQGWLLRSSGKAPLLFHSLHNGAAQFLEEAVQSRYTFRLRDLRKDPRAAVIHLDSDHLCSLLACPIQTNGHNSGLILVFGKQNGESFQDSDVFLAELLATNAAMNIESCFLNQELRNNLETTQLLYGLSLDISLAANLHQAVHVIAQTALRLTQANSCGLVLVGSDGRKEVSVLFPVQETGTTHPYELVRQAMDSQQIIYLAENEDATLVAIPIQTPRRCYGALWMEMRDEHEFVHHPAEEIRVLINQASVALERLIFLEETRNQASELEKINLQLEESYHLTLKALMRALDARDSDTEGHSERVNELADLLGKAMGLPEEEHKALLLGSLLHDIGKIAVPDQILHKKGPLDPSEWEAMRKHPERGVEIIQEIPYLKTAIPVIYFHQERWDGSGYPLRWAGEQIPLVARIFAVVDVFDALTRDRPYRRTNLTTPEAVDYLKSQAGIQFDPEVVDQFIQVIRQTGS